MRGYLDALEARHGLDHLTHLARRCVVISLSVLIALMVLRGFLLQGETFSWRPTLTFVLPLLLFLPTVIAKRPRGHAWLAFVSLLYFAQGVMVATLPGQTLRGILEALVSLALFVGCMGYARFRSRQLRQ